jgi:hypothetical protein
VQRVHTSGCLYNGKFGFLGALKLSLSVSIDRIPPVGMTVRAILEIEIVSQGTVIVELSNVGVSYVKTSLSYSGKQRRGVVIHWTRVLKPLNDFASPRRGKCRRYKPIRCLQKYDSCLMYMVLGMQVVK